MPPNTSHPKSVRRTLILSCPLVFSLVMPGIAASQGFPDRPIKVTVGFPPGSGPDIVARHVGEKLREQFKQTVVIDNRAGAGGQIGAQAVANSPPDGYNLLLGEVGSISIAPPAFNKLPYDPAKDLTILSEVVRADFVLVVPSTSPATTLEEFLNSARASADRVNFATFGAGTPGHFGAEILAGQGHFKVVPIHYRSTGDAVTAIAAGDVQAAFVTTALAVAQIKGGKVRALATTANQRSTLLQDVPTFAQAGMPQIDFSAWMAFFAPRGTPAPVVETLSRAIVASVKSPDVRQKLEDAGFRVLGTTPGEAATMVKGEATRWAEVVKASGFKGD